MLVSVSCSGYSPHPGVLALVIGHGLKDKECSARSGYSPHPVLLPLVIGHGLKERGHSDPVLIQTFGRFTSNFARVSVYFRSVKKLTLTEGWWFSPFGRVSEVRGGKKRGHIIATSFIAFVIFTVCRERSNGKIIIRASGLI